MYHHEELKCRASLTHVLSTLGIGWGLTPAFASANSSGYFDPELYPRYYARSFERCLLGNAAFLVDSRRLLSQQRIRI